MTAIPTIGSADARSAAVAPVVRGSVRGDPLAHLYRSTWS
jgi:hypothetical protein